jgi:hypothetical protein
VGFVVDKVALGQVSSDYFSFSLPILIPATAPYSLIILSSAASLRSKQNSAVVEDTRQNPRALFPLETILIAQLLTKFRAFNGSR